MNLFDTRSPAVFSRCRTWRFRLTRTWDGRLPRLVFLMLNPSTADESQDDPTIRRCIGYAKRDGFGGVEIVNLFAFRSTDPTGLVTARDPVGEPDNNQHIRNVCAVETVVCAWGRNGVLDARDRVVMAILSAVDAKPVCLGVNADGTPVHPLYQPKDAAFRVYGGRP